MRRLWSYMRLLGIRRGARFWWQCFLYDSESRLARRYWLSFHGERPTLPGYRRRKG